MNIKLNNLKLPTKDELKGEFDWYDTYDGYQEAVYSILVGGSLGTYIPEKFAELLECENFPNHGDEFYWDEMVYLMDSVNCSLTEMYDSNVYVDYIDSDGSICVLLRRIAK